MRKHVLRCSVLGLAMGLGACFESAQPLISTANADFPFTTTARYTFYEWNKEQKTWQPSETGTVSRDGDHYVQIDDGGLTQDAKPFLLKSIGDGYFIAQQPSDVIYIYDLLKIQGDVVYQFGMACADADKKFADQRLIDSFTKDSYGGNSCKVSDFDKLKQVLFAIAKDRPQPQGMYTLTK